MTVPLEVSMTFTEIVGYGLVLAAFAFVLWLKLRRHTGLGRQWCSDAGCPGSEGS